MGDNNLSDFEEREKSEVQSFQGDGYTWMGKQVKVNTGDITEEIINFFKKYASPLKFRKGDLEAELVVTLRPYEGESAIGLGITKYSERS